MPDIIPCTAEHDIPGGRVHLLGAVRDVTGAMTRVEIGGAVLLVDCGVAQGRAARDWTFPEAARDVDAVLLTHGHNDHVGSLPALIEGGYDRPILATRATFEIAVTVLRDGLMLGGASREEADRFAKRLRELHRPVKYDAATSAVDGFDGTIAFREAGHILGSASVELRSRQARVICSGDLGRPDTPILRTYNRAWDDDQPVDLVVLETTYGDREHEHSHAEIQRELERVLRRAIEHKGHILVPAFAIGRTQTLLYHLNALVEDKKLLKGVPVVVDSPMGLRVTETYAEFKHLYDREAVERMAYGDDPLDFDELYAARTGRDSARVRELDGPVIVIASSGMCTGGRIVEHLIELLPRPETCLLFVGYQAHGTPGREILEAADARRGDDVPIVEIRGEQVPLRAHVETLPGLSAHADRGELKSWLTSIPGVRRVALHHGEADAQHAFAAWAG